MGCVLNDQGTQNERDLSTRTCSPGVLLVRTTNEMVVGALFLINRVACIWDSVLGSKTFERSKAVFSHLLNFSITNLHSEAHHFIKQDTILNLASSGQSHHRYQPQAHKEFPVPGSPWWFSSCISHFYNFPLDNICLFFFLSSLHTQHRAPCGDWTHDSEIKIWAEIEGWLLNWLSQPGFPTYAILNNSFIWDVIHILWNSPT